MKRRVVFQLARNSQRFGYHSILVSISYLWFELQWYYCTFRPQIRSFQWLGTRIWFLALSCGSWLYGHLEDSREVRSNSNQMIWSLFLDTCNFFTILVECKTEETVTIFYSNLCECSFKVKKSWKLHWFSSWNAQEMVVHFHMLRF